MDDFSLKALQLLCERRRAASAAAAPGAGGGPVQALRWSAADKLDRHLWEHLERAVRRGALGPDRPIELSFDDTCLLNFGTTADLVQADMLAAEAEARGEELRLGQRLDPAQRATLQRRLGFLEMHYSELHASSGVYNLEPWLQEMYCDLLDFDRRQALRQRAAILQEEIRSTPDRLLDMGVPNDMVTEVMVALRSYQLVQGQARAREKSKTSVVRAREHAAITEQIRQVIERAGEHVLSAGEGGERSPLEDFFRSWKEARFELIEIGQELEELAGNALAERVDELTRMLAAARATLRRCAEEDGHPPCGLLAADEAGRLCPRQVVEEELEALLMHDIMVPADLAAERMETRRFGPLCALVAPGRGQARYSSELREFQAGRLDQAKAGRRDYDLDRRANYPLNYIVVPGLLAPEAVLGSLADAFLEYKAVAAGPAFRAALQECRQKFPEIFDSPAAVRAGGRDPQRRRLARYLAEFVRWAKYGRVMQPLPRIEEFIAWARQRLRRPELLVAPRYRCVLEDFAEASAERRARIFARHMRERVAVDRAALVQAVLLGDTEKAFAQADCLSAALRSNPYFRKALEPVQDRGPWGRQNAEKLLGRFLCSEPELKLLFEAQERRFSAELDTMRKRGPEKLGREISPAEARHALAQRHEQLLEARRQQANRDMDRDLVGLLYTAENNYPAAKAELGAYLERLEAQRHARRARPQTFDGSSLREVLGRRGERVMSGQQGGRPPASPTRLAGAAEEAVFEDDFVYYNLGSICLKTGDLTGAADYFSRFCLWAAQQHWHLFGEYARAIIEGVEKQRGEGDGAAAGGQGQ